MENWLPLPVMMNDNEELLLLFIDKVQTIYIICCEKVIIFKIIWPIKKTNFTSCIAYIYIIFK